MSYLSTTPSSHIVNIPADGEPKTPGPRGRPRGARTKIRLGEVQVDADTEENPTTDEATAEQYILSHLARHTEAASPRADMSAFADLLPPGALEDQIDRSLEPTGGGSETPSILSRLKKGTPGSCDICGRTETSVWRKLTLGGVDYKVCNGTYCSYLPILRLMSFSMRALPYQVRRDPPVGALGRWQERQEASAWYQTLSSASRRGRRREEEAS